MNYLEHTGKNYRYARTSHAAAQKAHLGMDVTLIIVVVAFCAILATII